SEDDPGDGAADRAARQAQGAAPGQRTRTHVDGLYRVVYKPGHRCAVHPAGNPDRNAFIERFNKSYRDEVLDAYVFESAEQVREVTETWLQEYNEERPHDSLGRVPPLMFMPRPQTTRESTYKLCP